MPLPNERHCRGEKKIQSEASEQAAAGWKCRYPFQVVANCPARGDRTKYVVVHTCEAVPPYHHSRQVVTRSNYRYLLYVRIRSTSYACDGMASRGGRKGKRGVASCCHKAAIGRGERRPSIRYVHVSGALSQLWCTRSCKPTCSAGLHVADRVGDGYTDSALEYFVPAVGKVPTSYTLRLRIVCFTYLSLCIFRACLLSPRACLLYTYEVLLDIQVPRYEYDDNYRGPIKEPAALDQC